jgi:hypothetical protein
MAWLTPDRCPSNCGNSIETGPEYVRTLAPVACGARAQAESVIGPLETLKGLSPLTAAGPSQAY